MALPTTGWAQTSPPDAPVDLIALLDRICVAAQGDRARAAALAAEAGFSPVPDSFRPRIRNSTETAAFMRTNTVDMTVVMTGKMTRRLGRERAVLEFCAVSARPTEHRALDARLRAAMGFASVRDSRMDIYAWLQTPEGRAPARSLSDPQFISMAETGQMRIVALERDGPGSTLLYILPRLD
ncbi:hypothetical protein [Brevundimonas sp.]|uniref:hypothetical protein n=1 Tax=Brevundimonas sp. TaxID=1871086 RepID=UPI003A949468